MNTHDDFDILGLNDPMKRKSTSAKMISTRDLTEYNEYQEKQKAALANRNKTQADAQRKRERIAEMRFEVLERAQKERNRIELLRHQENRRLSLIAIGIAVVSLVIAIFK